MVTTSPPSSIPLRSMPSASTSHASTGIRSSPSNENITVAMTPTRLRYRTANFLFGLLNNALYVVILTAALELLPAGVPTGLVAFANIAPALVAKAVWPYLLKGEVRYAKRVVSCTALSFVGMLLISLNTSLAGRLTGISLASFSSGLGELTFLQLSTRYGPSAGDGVGWFASGTGAAGLLGAAAWWAVRPLGVRTGLGILSLVPFAMAAAYFVVLPSREALDASSPVGAYAPLGTEDVRTSEDEEEDMPEPRRRLSTSSEVDAVRASASIDSPLRVSLPFATKMALLRPMLLVYIAPLVLVYLFEYTINQGVAPTLLYPLPTKENHPLLSLVIKKLSDYYPLYQLTYQTFVFLSRSSISILRLPPIPKSMLWVPAILQGAILLLLTSESLHPFFKQNIASPLVIVLICIEGLAGGSAYVSVFYQISRAKESELKTDEANSGETEAEREARLAQIHEFRIGCVGLGDSAGILLAAVISMPLELALCSAQVAAGRTLCREVKA